jgi:hypothetical protein
VEAGRADQGLFQASEEDLARYRDERAALERVVRNAKARAAEDAAGAAALVGTRGMPRALVGARGSSHGGGGSHGGGSSHGGGARTGGETGRTYEISSDEGSEEGSGDGLSATLRPAMSEEDELALVEAKERIRQQKEERLKQVRADKKRSKKRKRVRKRERKS